MPGSTELSPPRAHAPAGPFDPAARHARLRIAALGLTQVAARGRYRKGEQRRREILLAAIEVFARRGYRNASIREIADTVGLTQAGLLHYFASKEEMFTEVLRVRDELESNVTDDLIESWRIAIERNSKVEGLVHLFVTVSADAIDENHPGHAYFTHRYDDFIGLVGEWIQDRQDRGLLSSRIEARVAARMLVALSDGLQIQWLFDPEHTDMPGIFDQLLRDLLGAAEVDGRDAPRPGQP